MLFEVAGKNPIDVYHLLVGIVTPRPIAWVTSLDEEGRVNLAPYSFFNVFGSSPPVVVFSPTIRRDGSRKDTLLNIEQTGEFVLNCAVESVIEALNLTAKELPRGESEVELARLTLIPSQIVKTPRIAESPAHLECRLLQILPVGTGPMAANLVIGEALAIHVDDAVLDESGRIDPAKLKTVGRLNGDWYANTSDQFALKRPE